MKRSSYLLWTVYLLCFWLQPVQAQSGRVPAKVASDLCGCDKLVQEAKSLHFYSDLRAQSMINSYTALFKNPAGIYPKPYACITKGTIYAMLCEQENFIGKYIFYNPFFMDKMITEVSRADQFLLAHEIAHHLLGHTERAYRLEKKSEIVSDVYQGSYSETDKSGVIKKYSIGLPQKHLHELEADALGLWMAIQKGATQKDIQQIFDILPRVTSEYSDQFDKYTYSDTHPSIYNRQEFIKKQWAKYLRSPKQYGALQETDVDRQNFDDEKGILYKEAEDFYAFQLLTAKKDKQVLFNRVEREIRDSLNKGNHFYLDVLVGANMQYPRLQRDIKKIKAANARGFTGGLRLGTGAWYKPHHFETDFRLGASEFTTQGQVNGRVETIEKFRTTYLYIQPKYVFSRINRQSEVVYQSRGWLASVGFSANVPLRTTYVNYGVEDFRTLPLKTDLSPVAGIGYGVSNWRNRKGHFRVWLTYIPQRMNFVASDQESVKAVLHTFQMDFSFRFW